MPPTPGRTGDARERRQVTSELRALHDLSAANRDVHIVVSHDTRQLADYEAAGKIGKGFSKIEGK